MSMKLKVVAMAAVVIAALAMEAMSQTPQENAERTLDRLLQPESASSLDTRRKAFWSEKNREDAYRRDIEATEREKLLRWERATPAERLIMEQEKEKRIAALEAGIRIRTNAEETDRRNAEIEKRNIDILEAILMALLLLGILGTYIYFDRRTFGQSRANLIWNDCCSVATWVHEKCKK